MSNWDWLVDMSIWERATDALGLDEELEGSEGSTQAQEEPISQPGANGGASDEGSEGL